MKFCFSSLATLALLFSSSAQAFQAPVLTPVDPSTEAPTLTSPPQNLRLVGKGLKNRRTHESIALACVGPLDKDQLADCTRLQFIYFPVDAEPRFEGKIYKIETTDVTEPSTDAIKSEVKSITESYKTWRHNSERLSEEARTGITYGAFATVFVGQAVGMLTQISKVGGLYLAGALILFYVGAAIFVENDGYINVGAGEISSVIRDQNGWNWHDKPQKINNHKFNKFHEFVNRN